MEKIRSFIAINIPLEIIEKIKEIILELQEIKLIKCVELKNLHITIRFLGNITINDAYFVLNIINSIPDELKKIKISIEGIGVFPSLKNPRVIWLGIKKGSAEILKLFNYIEPQLSEKLNLKEEEFKPHLTVARIKQRDETILSKIEEIVNKYKDKIWGEFENNSIYLYKSILKPSGPEYSLIS